GARSTGVIGYGPTAVTLDVSTDSITWSGVNGSTWTTGSTGFVGGTPNWATTAGHTATDFWASDIVKFGDTYNSGSGDTAVTNTAVSISGGNVSPASVTFNNSAVNYTISSGDGSGIAGNGVLTKNGTGKVTISSSNSYTGATAVNNGILNLQNSSALGATSGVTVAAGAALELQGGITVDRALSLSGTGQGSGALRNVQDSNTYSGLLTLAGDTTLQSDSGTLAITNAGTITGSGFNLTVAGSGNGSIASNISVGSGSLTKNGSGTWTLSGASNAFTGLTMNGGALTVNGTNSGGTTINSGSVILSSGNAAGSTVSFGASSNGTLSLNGNSVTLTSLTGDSTATVQSNSATAGTDTLTVNNGSNNTFAGILKNGSTRSLALTKGGAGTLTLSGSNSYSGATTISAGTLEFQSATAMSTASALTVANGGTLGLFSTSGTTFTASSFNFSPATTGIANIVVNSTNPGQTITLAGTPSTSGGTSNDTVNISSTTTGDTLAFGNQWTLPTSGSAWAGPATTFNLSNVNVTLSNGISSSDGGLIVSSTTGSTLTISGIVANASARTVFAQVNSGVLVLNNTVNNPGGANNGFFAILNGGTLDINNNGALNNNAYASGHGTAD